MPADVPVVLVTRRGSGCTRSRGRRAATPPTRPGVRDLVGQVLAGVDVEHRQRAALVAALATCRTATSAAVGRRVVPVDRAAVSSAQLAPGRGACAPRRRGRRPTARRSALVVACPPLEREERGRRDTAAPAMIGSASERGQALVPPAPDRAGRRAPARVRWFWASIHAATSAESPSRATGTDRRPRRRAARRPSSPRRVGGADDGRVSHGPCWALAVVGLVAAAAPSSSSSSSTWGQPTEADPWGRPTGAARAVGSPTRDYVDSNTGPRRPTHDPRPTGHCRGRSPTSNQVSPCRRGPVSRSSVPRC